MLGVKTVTDEIFTPLTESVNMLFCKGYIIFSVTDCGAENYHISAFFNGHLIFKPVFGINLTVENRILANIVGSKVIFPLRCGGIMENGAKHTLQKLGIIKQIHRC